MPNNGGDVFSKFEANVTPQGEKVWDIVIEEVFYFTAAPTVERNRVPIFNHHTFEGTEEECRTEVCSKLKKLVVDRDAVENLNAFKMTEEDLV